VSHTYGFADGDGIVESYRVCGSTWWLTVGLVDPQRKSRFFDFREAYEGWRTSGFASFEQADACAKAFVAAENARSPGHAPEQGD